VEGGAVSTAAGMSVKELELRTQELELQKEELQMQREM